MVSAYFKRTRSPLFSRYVGLENIQLMRAAGQRLLLDILKHRVTGHQVINEYAVLIRPPRDLVQLALAAGSTPGVSYDMPWR